MDSASFVNTIVKNILGKDISGGNNLKYDGSRNTLRQCIRRNKGIGNKVITMISNMIDIELDINKKNNAKKYLFDISGCQNLNLNTRDLVTLAVEKIKKTRTQQINTNIRMVKFNELIKLGWTHESYILDCLNLWEKTVDIPTEHNGDLNQWLPIIKNYPNNREVLLNQNNEIIGYWNFEPLFNDIFDKAKNGELLDGELQTDMIPPFLDGIYNIYIISVMIRDDYRGEGFPLKKILLSMIEYVNHLASENIFINEICAWAYTESGIALAKHIGLKFHKNHIETGKIYLGNIHDLLNQTICENFDELKKIYKLRGI